MNPQDLYNSVVLPLSSYLGIPFVRKDESGTAPSGIYGMYKIIRIESDTGGHFPNREDVINADPTQISTRYWKTQNAIVSLSIRGDEDGVNDVLNDIYNYSADAMDYLALHGRDDFRSAGLSVDLSESILEDLTVFNGTLYEYNVGFTVIVKANREITIVSDAVDMDATFDAITEEIIYGE